MAMAIAVDTPATCKVEPVSWYVCAGTATTSSPIPSSEINRAEKAYLKGRLVRKGETSITSPPNRVMRRSGRSGRGWQLRRRSQGGRCWRGRKRVVWEKSGYVGVD